MSMLLGIGALLASSMGVVYLGRKGWHAFHRAVGITPGTLRYIEPKALPPPQLMQLSIDTALLTELPPAVVSLLTRIDDKACLYQQWQEEQQCQGLTVANSEQQFVLRKLLSERIPEMLQYYQSLAQYQQQCHQTSAPEPLDKKQAATLGTAYSLLLELLASTEKRLDDLLLDCSKEQVQQLQVMKRYLDSLD